MIFHPNKTFENYFTSQQNIYDSDKCRAWNSKSRNKFLDRQCLPHNLTKRVVSKSSFCSKSRPKDDVSSLMVLLESENKYFLHIQEGAKD